MAYIGNPPADRYSKLAKQDLTGDGTVGAYTLDYAVGSVAEIEVFVNNVRQEPTTAYTVAGDQLTMTGNVASTDDFYVVFQGKAIASGQVPEKQSDGSYVYLGDVDINGNDLILDADGDSKIEASTDDTVNIISGGTTGLTIGSGGIVTHPTRPIFSARGVATSTSLTAAASYFDTVTSWTETDVDVGSLLQSGGYAEVPSGFAGIYQITWVHNRTTTTAYHSAILFHYDGSTYTNLMTHYANSDYNNYTVGTTFFYNLAVGDRIYVGWNDAYGIPETNAYASNFSMMFVG